MILAQPMTAMTLRSIQQCMPADALKHRNEDDDCKFGTLELWNFGATMHLSEMPLLPDRGKNCLLFWCKVIFFGGELFSIGFDSWATGRPLM